MNAIEQFKSDYLKLRPAMQRMAESLLGSEDEAEDAVQDCFVTLWSQREKLKRVVNREAWCITLVKNRCLDRLRRRRPTVDIDETNILNADVPEEDNRIELALKMMECLPERQALAIRMKHYENADTKQIAHAMNISEGNVYVLLSRAYQSLKQKITEYEHL